MQHIVESQVVCVILSFAKPTAVLTQMVPSNRNVSIKCLSLVLLVAATNVVYSLSSDADNVIPQNSYALDGAELGGWDELSMTAGEAATGPPGFSEDAQWRERIMIAPAFRRQYRRFTLSTQVSK